MPSHSSLDLCVGRGTRGEAESLTASSYDSGAYSYGGSYGESVSYSYETGGDLPPEPAAVVSDGFTLEWSQERLQLRLYQHVHERGHNGSHVHSGGHTHDDTDNSYANGTRRVVWESVAGQAFVALGVGHFKATNHWNSFKVRQGPRATHGPLAHS